MSKTKSKPPGRKPTAPNGLSAKANFIELHNSGKLDFSKAIHPGTGKKERGFVAHAKEIYKKMVGVEASGGIKEAYKEVTGLEWPAQSGAAGAKREKKTVDLVKLIKQIKEAGGMAKVADAMAIVGPLLRHTGSMKAFNAAIASIEAIKDGL